MTKLHVPFVDLPKRHAEERDEILACVDRVLADGQLIGGREVEGFEDAAARYVGVRRVVALNSGTDALMMAMWACGIGKGDEVITTPISFVATTAAIVHVGARPVYVDVGEDQNLDPDRIEASLTRCTRAILPVHWGGRVADMAAIDAIARRHGLIVIEDAAQAMGAERGGRRAGTFGELAAFSAHPLKPFAALGDAGFLATNNVDRASRVAIYRTHGLETRDRCVSYGVNSRLDALQAAVLELRLRRLDELLEVRRALVAKYRARLREGAIRLPSIGADERPTWSFLNARAERRDELAAFLRARGIETLVYYGTALHLHPAASSLGYRRGDFAIAERQCDEVIALPCHAHLSDDQIDHVATSIDAFYGS